MKQNVKKNDLIKFNYIFSPKEKYYGLICEVKSCYSFKTLVNVLIDKKVQTIPINIIKVIEEYNCDE